MPANTPKIENEIESDEKRTRIREKTRNPGTPLQTLEKYQRLFF